MWLSFTIICRVSYATSIMVQQFTILTSSRNLLLCSHDNGIPSSDAETIRWTVPTADQKWGKVFVNSPWFSQDAYIHVNTEVQFKIKPVESKIHPVLLYAHYHNLLKDKEFMLAIWERLLQLLPSKEGFGWSAGP